MVGVHRRVHDDDVGALADLLEVGDLQSGDLRLSFLRVAHHALQLARKVFQPESRAQRGDFCVAMEKNALELDRVV